ncbi:MAG TPA: SDR family NAD(P)-dependent oxidoreductase [Candidatus Acidoferrales bacterium]|jgi:3-oxoacyl-[acyl-carrier protein] reductase|nr:SDR family NAD(P)-dependent oxidoreductase [Candidatus Acidoferrales bacterium]
MSDLQLSGKVALVTGGGRGIGASIAVRLATLGAAIVVCGRTQSHIDQTAGRIRAAGGRAEAMTCDVSDWESVTALAGKVEKMFGKLEIVVNNAGIGGFGGPLHTMPVERWDAVLNTNLRGVFYTIRAFVPLLLAAGGGHIINISSIAGKNPLPNGAAYAASKWGLNGLSYSVAEELRAHQVRVSVICPGSTHTELSPHEGKEPEKMLQADDIAHVVEMLVTQAPQSFVSEIVLRPTQKP